MSITSGWKMACALFLLCAATPIVSPAQTFRVLVKPNPANNWYPDSPLVQGLDGDLYGTTSGGGDLTCNAPYGCGTIFKTTRGGVLTLLHRFCVQSDCTDGSIPLGGLLQSANGTFYGTTQQGGAHDQGTVFRITPTGKLTTLYSFCAQPGCADGAVPTAGVVQGTDGDLYGTTSGGGHWNGGTVFKITPGGTLTTLFSFFVAVQPSALVQATDGNFYGTTYEWAYGSGTVFKITPSGTLTTLYSFCAQTNCTDGANPNSLWCKSGYLKQKLM